MFVYCSRPMALLQPHRGFRVGKKVMLSFTPSHLIGVLYIIFLFLFFLTISDVFCFI